MMGGLHILFNFVKAIGQHMKNAGLDDVWVELLFQSWARERLSLQDIKDEVKLLHDLFEDKHNETVDVKISEQVLQLLQTLRESVITNGLWI